MASFVRMSKNFVNLGTLYSPLYANPPWRPSGTKVNLGNLYTAQFYQRRTGFGYFEDGSIFINPRGYAEHDAFEAEMKLLLPFVRGPSPKLEQIRQSSDERKRLIVIAQNKVTGSSHTVYARNAKDGEMIVVGKWPFERIKFATDPTHSRLLLAKFDRKPKILGYQHRLSLVKALATFRGTLVDGVLQPNVRLGNGLTLTTSVKLDGHVATKAKLRTAENVKTGAHKHPAVRFHPVPPKRRDEKPEVERRREIPGLRPNRQLSAQNNELSDREAELNRRERELLRLQQQLLLRAVAPPRERSAPPGRYDPQEEPPTSNRPAEGPTSSHSRISDLELRERDFELRERELQHKNELLRWKHKNLVLQKRLAQQKLARARAKGLVERWKTEESMTTLSPTPEDESFDELFPGDSALPEDPTPADEPSDPFSELYRIKLPKRR
ncbi:hypothetical protein K458DRAFT_381577 [Lentithecium fluviatile CBS 122367]|uniref:Uncharacterized protein n=1 Tax=Lentithecium fluviatile CBS 122367 TaxID=1168545 RepID=A0A6G1JNN5_9PLEO|nr:hypothetical protein K458DRAFT_381577 [Lentithecium fluviatile CBS 122367]